MGIRFLSWSTGTFAKRLAVRFLRPPYLSRLGQVADERAARRLAPCGAFARLSASQGNFDWLLRLKSRGSVQNQRHGVARAF